MKKLAVIIIVLGMMVCTNVNASDVSDLEDLNLSADSYWNGSDLEGSYSATDSFATGDASFNNFYAYDDVFMYSSWGGFAYSNITDTAATGFTSQYNAITGKGENNSSNYAVGYCNTYAAGQPTITFENAQTVSGVYITNTNYAYYSMRDGDGFAKKFGGASGDDEDWFLLTITGKDEDGLTKWTEEFYLADFRGSNAEDYIINDWTLVDLKDHQDEIKTLEFALTSSDSGAYGMNTPAYFAMDTLDESGDFENLTLAAESYWNGSDLNGSYTATDEFTSGIATYNNYYSYDSVYMYSSWGGFAYSNIMDTLATGFTSQYNAITGSGHYGSRNYAIGYLNAFNAVIPTITLDTARTISAVRITNTNYAYYSMLDGDGFAKKFGGPTGADEDWFLLTIIGKDAVGDPTGTVEFYLADFRFVDNADDYIIKDWTLVELSSLGEVKSLEFGLSSSDGGQGMMMNTPAYFAIDNISVQDEDGNGDDDNWLEGCFINVIEGAID